VREIWYGRLLRLYPAGHPRDEMLDVLLASGAPVHREVVPLVLGGLRARCGGDQSPRVRWLYAARAAALMLLVVATLTQVPPRILPGNGSLATAWIAAAVAAVAVTAGTRRPAAVFASVAFVVSAVDDVSWSYVGGYLVACALLLIPGPRTPVASPLPWALALLCSADAVPQWFFLAALAGTALWAAVADERILIAIGLALCATVPGLVDDLVSILSLPDFDDHLMRRARQIVILAVLLPTVPLAFGAVIARRRSRV
jgi:hypothetical protein